MPAISDKDVRLVTNKKNLMDEATTFYKKLYSNLDKSIDAESAKVNCLQIV